jgi:hypothetical protein
MREVVTRVRDALRHRGFAAFVGLLLVSGCGLVGLPLMNLPGYELGAGLALLQGLLGGAVGVFHARRAPRAPGLATAAATATLWLLLVPPLLLAALRTWAFSRCDPFATAAFVPLLTLPTGLLASAAGVWVGTVTRRWWAAALLWLALVALSAVHTTWPILFGPQVFAYNHLAGFLPGPLYDEVLHVPASLAWFRLGTVAVSAVFVALARLWAVPTRGARDLGALALAAAALALVEGQGVGLGFRMSDEALAARLGGTWEDDALVIHYPEGLPREDVARLVGDVRFRHHQLVEFFGAAPPGKVRVWWYRAPAEKQALVGAERTQFAKPWRREVHVNGNGFPHPVLKHELVHAMASPWGSAPFGVTARLGGLAPHVGIIEGLAVAADNPIDELSLHEWAAAMKRRGLLPDVRTLLEPQGFYAAPASRAYTTAGSFIRWLGETHGKPGLRALYARGDFEAVYGAPLATLAGRWEQFLDGLALDERAVSQAFARFRGGSLFDRPCAREVAQLSAQASAEAHTHPSRALDLTARCRALQPEEPAHVLAQARALERLGQPAEAARLLDEQLERFADEPSLFADAALPRVQLAVDAGDDLTARRLLTALLERRVGPAVDRTARVRLAALSMPPAARAAVDSYFSATDDAAQLYRLREALEAMPGEPVLAYLLGRRLAGAGEGAEALRWLDRAREAELPETLAREAARLSVEAAFTAHRCARLEALAAEARWGAAFSAQASDWLARCRFDSR